MNTEPQPLSPIERSTAAEQCTRELRRRILDGQFAAGTKLPPERTLAVELGVNRVTVRTALATLAAERLVTVRHGSGAVVADFLETGGPGLIAELVGLATGGDAASALADLLAVRRALARVVVEKLVHRVDAAARARLKSAVQTFARVVAERRDAASVARADLEVIRALVAETRSPVLQLCLNPVAAVLPSVSGLREAMYAEPERSLFAYEALVEALAAPPPDFASAVDAMLAEHDRETLRRFGARRRTR